VEGNFPVLELECKLHAKAERAILVHVRSARLSLNMAGTERGHCASTLQLAKQIEQAGGLGLPVLM
jgi:hypothetical protein